MVSGPKTVYWLKPYALLKVESYRKGIPCVATDISGSKDLIINQETGILVPPANAANLANGLHDKKTERARILGQNSRAKITAEFDIRLIAEQYISLYEAVSKKDSKLNLPH